MRIFSSMTGLMPRNARPADLKTSLIVRIALAALACFVLVTVAVLWDSDREARRQAAATADMVAKHLSFQLLRINAGFDLSNRYPDWEALLSNNQARGQCVRLENPLGGIVRSDCVGSLAVEDTAPHWFAAAWSLLSPETPAESAVSYKGKAYGSVIVTSDPKVAASRAWTEMRHLLILTALTILALAALVYVAIARALAPTKNVVAGLNKLSAGELSYRLPAFKLTELQRIAEVTNELAERVEATLAERAEISRKLMNAQEDERRRLASELHDAFGQNLTAIAALAASIEKTADEDWPELRAEARSLLQISMTMMQSLRATLLDLRPADFDKFGLTESLKQLVDVWSVSSRRKTRFELNISRELAPLSDTAAIHIYRIAQEGLTNAAKHADAKTVRLSVEPVSLAQPKTPHAKGIRLTIEDDGKGRRPNGKANASGRGLINMQERVAALGGTISLDDHSGAGFTVCVVVPVQAAEAPDHERPT
jgi:two-component system, NarL family, sensor histidine kinase UhpB